MRCELRPATQADRDYLYRLNETTMRDHVVATWGAWDDAFQQKLFANRFDPENRSIIQIAGESAGMLRVVRSPEAIDVGILLDPAYQRRGIGTALLTSLIEEAANSGRTMTLQVLKVNSQARALYERLGLRVIEETDTHHRMGT